METKKGGEGGGELSLESHKATKVKIEIRMQDGR